MGRPADATESVGAVRESASAGGRRMPRIALLGNPNTGKTTLFNRLSGLRHKTANFPGTTLEARLGRVQLGLDGGWGGAKEAGGNGDLGADLRKPDCCDAAPVQRAAEEHDAALIDLPGIYSLELEQIESAICRDVLSGGSAAAGDVAAAPEAVCIVIDATNLARNLLLVGEALRRRLPTVVAVNMIDLAHRQGLRIDAGKLSEAVGCEAVCVSARTGEGLAGLRGALCRARIPTKTPPGNEAGLRAWAEGAFEAAATAPEEANGETLTDRLDHAFTHPVLGTVLFALIMGGLFYVLFALAKYPMDAIDGAFGAASEWIKATLPGGVLRDLLADGVVAGVGATVVFLPQICLLFFLISLLEDTGYLARAAFVMDRVLRPFGLPGHAFVPLLSSHACALPGIMATRTIPDRRERLATILVAPFMTCSARLPVYVLLVSILFKDRPAAAAAAFVGCYGVGICAGALSALVARRTVLRGKARPMALELPTYKRPSVKTALITTYDRALVFLKKAGTNILMICIALWWLGAYPHVEPPARVAELRQQAAAVEAAKGEGFTEKAAELENEAVKLERSHAKAHSFIGRLGRAAEPVFRPLGYDWQLTVGVLTSFAAREVFVTTMAVVTAGEADAESEGVLGEIAEAKRDDGSPVFTRATAWSLLVFFVLAMQCLPTLAVTAREAGGAKWAWLQLGWMSVLAYTAAAVVYWVMR